MRLRPHLSLLTRISWKILGASEALDAIADPAAPMLDPVVRAKVQMTKSNADLQVHIPPEHLIKQLGGNNDWEWEFTPPTEEEAEPQQDKAMVKKLTAQREKLIQQYTDVTRKWAKSDGHDEALNLTRELLRNRLRVQSYGASWSHGAVLTPAALDPYARGRSVYHRHGNIVGNGLVRSVAHRSKPR